MRIIKWLGVIVAGWTGFSAVAVEMPAGYTQLEWVRSTGQQNVNTGWKASKTLRATMDFIPHEQTGNIMLGTGKNDVLQAWRFFNYGGGFIFDCASNNGSYIRVGQDASKKLDTTTRYVLECGINDANQVYATATDVATGTVLAPAVKTAGGTPPEAEDVYVFGGALKAVMCYERMTLYSLQLSDVVDGTRQLVRDFVPCRSSSHEVGLWDRVEGKFYGSQGAGHLVGPDDPATKVTYLIANGYEHAKTGVYATKTLQAELDWAPLAATGDIVVGTHVDTSDAVAWRYFNASWHYYFDCGCGSGSNGRVNDGGTMTSGTRYLSKFGTEDGNPNLAYLDVTRLTDGAKVVNHKTASSNNNIESQPVCVCGGNMKGVLSSVAMRLWSVKFMDVVDGTRRVVGDYVPAIQGGMVGLRDLANGNQFYGNTAKGAFTWGGIAYTDDGGVLAVHEGTLAEAEQDVNDFSIVSKVGHYMADFSGVTSYPALNIAEGTFSLQNGATGDYVVRGALTVAGGTHLKFDVSDTACDHITAGSVVLTASATNPIFIDLTSTHTNHQYATAYALMPLPAGADASIADCFVASCDEVPFSFHVENGNLVMSPRTDLIVSATWKGDTRSPASFDVSDPENWTCVNTLGTVVTGALPTEETAVIVPSGSTFNWPKGTTFAFKTVQLPSTLGGDCDWSGCPLALTGTLDLGGHTLTLAQPDGTATVTNGVLRMVVGSGETRTARSINDTIVPGEKVKFVFESASEHPIEVNDQLLVKSGDVDILAGTLRLVHGNLAGAAVPGTLYVAAGATLDYNLPDNVYKSLSLNESTHGKTLVLAGTVLNDGAGQEGPNALMCHLVVREGGTIGGRTVNATGSVMNRIDARNLASSSETNLVVEGAVPLTTCAGVKMVFSDGPRFALDRIDNRGGWVQFEGTCKGSVTNGLHCSGGTVSYWSGGRFEGLDVIVEEGTAEFNHPVESITIINQSLEIKDGATFHGDCTSIVTWNGVLKGNGSLTGSNIVMGGDLSCWRVRANAAGFTSIVKVAEEDLAFITNLKMFDVELEDDTLPERLVVCPAGTTTSGQASLITVRIHTVDGRECAVGWLTVEEIEGSAKVVLNVAQGLPVVTALWKGWNKTDNLLAPENWICSNAMGLVEGAYPTEVTAVTIPGNSDFSCPLETPLVCRTIQVSGPLTHDCDWAGLKGLFVDEIDLNGHRLTLGMLNGLGSIVNSAADTLGEVCVTVPTGRTVPADYATVQLGENIAFVKDGAGALDVQDTVLAQACDVQILDGLAKIIHGKQVGAARAGTLLIDSNAMLDANLPNRIYTDVNLNDPTHGKTIVLRGCLFNDGVGAVDANAILGRVIVEEGGRIGGPAETGNRIDMRTLSGSANNVAVLEGAVPLTLLRNNYLVFSGATVNLDRIDNRGRLWIEGTVTGSITNGVHCFGSSELCWWDVVNAAGLKVVIEEGVCDFSQKEVTETQSQMDLEIKAGATVNKVGSSLLTWNGRLSGSGSIQGYAFQIGGANSCWVMKADDTGFTEKVSFIGEVGVNVFKTLKRIEVQYTGDPSVPKRLVIAPCGWLTQAEANAIELVVTDANGESLEGFSLYVNGEQQLELQVGFATIEKATYIGAGDDPNDLSDPANWSCTTAGLPVTGVPMALTELTIPDDKVFTCTNAAQIAYAKINFPSSLPGDSDWRGLGSVAIDTTINLNGHKLYVSDLKGTGTLYSGVQEIEWIESDGGQFVDIGLVPKATLQAEMDFIPRDYTGEALVGVYANADTDDWRFADFSGGAFFDCGNARAGATSNGAIVTLGTRYKAEFGTDGSKIYNRINGGSLSREQTANANGSPNASRTIYVFANNSKGTAMCAKMRLYSLKFWDVTAAGKQLVRDLVPARRAGDGMAGLFDRVGCVFYPNKGTKPFQGSISTYTGSVGLSELHINVPAPRTVDNATVAISGGIKVVKEGGGTFRSTKGGQTWGGGTVVDAGQFMAKKECYPWAGVEDEVVINSNGVFNVWGGGDCVSPSTKFTLAGGTIANLMGDCGAGNASIGTVRLTADSKLDAQFSLGFVGGGYAPTLLDLAGHELTVNIGVGKRFYVDNCEMTKGKITVTAGGFITFDKTSVRASQTDFDLNCAITLNCPVDVHDLTMRWGTAQYLEGASWINIHGTYTPVSDYLWHFNLMDGSTIDLRGRTSPLPAGSQLTSEDGARVKVKLDLANIKKNEPLITWDAKPNAKFTAVASMPCGLIARDDGLYATTGLTLFLR
ncbi:MAG: hypothetical protein MJ249_06155 [Kiritimatiellae bacterium]|nr:hypothetical protein [Kiritimatiellia bacterium]